MSEEKPRVRVTAVRYSSSANQEGEDSPEVLLGDDDTNDIVASIPTVSSTNIDALMSSRNSHPQEDIYLKEQETQEETPSQYESIVDLPYENYAEIYTYLKSKYGDLFLKWEPETLMVVIKDDFALDDIPDELWQSILAIQTVGIGAAWDDYFAFEKAAAALSGAPTFTDEIQYVSPKQMSSLYKFMKATEPKGELSDEVMRYIAARLYMDNYIYSGDAFPPDVQEYINFLGVSQDLLSRVKEKVSAIELKDSNTVSSFLESLSENAVDIQVARYLDLL